MKKQSDGYWDSYPRKCGLYANRRKCRFSTDEVHFLGYIILPPVVYMEPERIESVKNWHDEAVRWVLEHLLKYGLYANFKKCRFSTDEVHILGYIISPPGVSCYC